MNFKWWNFHPFRRSSPQNLCPRAKVCDHPLISEGTVTVFGKEVQFGSRGVILNTDYCAQCIANMAIRCAWCGNIIFIGDPVTLLRSTDESQMPDYAVRYVQDASLFIGCVDMDCCWSGGCLSGRWVTPGSVQLLSQLNL